MNSKHIIAYLNKLQNFLIKTNIIFFVLIFFSLVIGINLLITSLPFAESIANPPEIIELKKDTGFFILYALIIGPLMETMLFQFAITMGVFYLMEYFKKPQFTIPVIVSALAFGFVHPYNLTYIIIAIFVGFFFATAYVLLLKRKENAFIVVTIIHSLVNFVPVYRDFLM